MGMRGRSLLMLLLLSGPVVSAGPARAASLLSIEFQVTGGGFASSTGFANGPITGGTIRWVADTVVETPGVPIGRFTQFSLTGPSGFFSFLVDIPANSGFINQSSIALYGFRGSLPAAIRSGANPTLAGTFPISLYVAPFVCASVVQSGSRTHGCRANSPFRGEARGYLGTLVSETYGIYRNRGLGHFFTVGAEIVRTYVPEPGSGLLLGAALLGMLVAPAVWRRSGVRG